MPLLQIVKNQQLQSKAPANATEENAQQQRTTESMPNVFNSTSAAQGQQQLGRFQDCFAGSRCSCDTTTHIQKGVARDGLQAFSKPKIHFQCASLLLYYHDGILQLSNLRHADLLTDFSMQDNIKQAQCEMTHRRRRVIHGEVEFGARGGPCILADCLEAALISLLHPGPARSIQYFAFHWMRSERTYFACCCWGWVCMTLCASAATLTTCTLQSTICYLSSD